MDSPEGRRSGLNAHPLPPHLQERVRVVGEGTPGPGPVIYWMRMAVRGHENPALDTALYLARAMRRPMFVYHALSERYPYASDRHHRFILEGARDVQVELAERGIAYAFHLERPGHRGSHLKTLGAGAALVVTEDVPVAPLAPWTHSLARAIVAPVWAVDSSCTFPMRRVPGSSVDRAFRFRKATAEGRAERIEAGWTDEQPHRRPLLPDLPFEPLDLAVADLDALVARCGIDHAVAPVPHTPGGSQAGYRRWREFVDSGRLAAYARTRNDPLRDGVSRMSPYLHYGQVSPFRIAREAMAAGEDGAKKYLDELLVWRELAWAFCAAHPEHASIDVLPEWARATLAEHEGDERPALPSWETLARGRTGDALWDAAQRSLLTHGELHNNVRMTWGKAFIGWTPDAATALARMEDLNHRYALDGRDPASYGGLLWCLGTFDRPFSPEAPILGALRPRPTHGHARRLDPAAYAARTGRAARLRPPRVAVIGAGIAGLACARTLVDHGLEPELFDKGRRPGGRCATRENHDDPQLRFDHGAQCFSARSEPFRRLVASWAHDGLIAPWPGRVLRVEGRSVSPADHGDRWVGVPSMAALPAHLASDLDVRCGVRIRSASRVDGAFLLRSEQGLEYGPFDAVVVTTPPAQAVPLLEASPALAAAAGRVRLLPCQTALLSFGRRVEVEADALLTADTIIDWAARDSGKPGRPAGERWVVHGAPGWSEQHVDEDPERVAAALIEAFGHLIERLGGPRPEPTSHTVHRWRYARVAKGPGADTAALADPSIGLLWAGDGVLGEARLEAAWLSGVAAAARLLALDLRGPDHTGGPPSAPLGAPVRQTDLFG